MKSFYLGFITLFSLIIISWCNHNKTITNTSETTTTNNTESSKKTGIKICDNYLSAVQCIADVSTGIDKINFDKNYQSIVQSFKDVPAEQLSKTCTTLSDALRTHPTLLKDNPKCNIL